MHYCSKLMVDPGSETAIQRVMLRNAFFSTKTHKNFWHAITKEFKLRSLKHTCLTQGNMDYLEDPTPHLGDEFGRVLVESVLRDRIRSLLPHSDRRGVGEPWGDLNSSETSRHFRFQIGFLIPSSLSLFRLQFRCFEMQRFQCRRGIT